MLSVEKTNKADAWKIRLVVLSVILIGIVAVNITPVEVVINLKNGNNIFNRVPDMCLMQNVFGVPCPLCGMSRGFAEILHLNFLGGIYYNPFSVIFYPLSFIIITAIFTLSLFNYKLKITKPRTFGWGIFVLFIVVWTVNIIWGHHS